MLLLMMMYDSLEILQVSNDGLICFMSVTCLRRSLALRRLWFRQDFLITLQHNLLACKSMFSVCLFYFLNIRWSSLLIIMTEVNLNIAFPILIYIAFEATFGNVTRFWDFVKCS